MSSISFFGSSVAFLEHDVPLSFHFFMESTSYVFLPDDGFLPCVTTGWILASANYVRIQSINQPSTGKVILGYLEMSFECFSLFCMGATEPRKTLLFWSNEVEPIVPYSTSLKKTVFCTASDLECVMAYIHKSTHLLRKMKFYCCP